MNDVISDDGMLEVYRLWYSFYLYGWYFAILKTSASVFSKSEFIAESIVKWANNETGIVSLRR